MATRQNKLSAEFHLSRYLVFSSKHAHSREFWRTVVMDTTSLLNTGAKDSGKVSASAKPNAQPPKSIRLSPRAWRASSVLGNVITVGVSALFGHKKDDRSFQAKCDQRPFWDETRRIIRVGRQATTEAEKWHRHRQRTAVVSSYEGESPLCVRVVWRSRFKGLLGTFCRTRFPQQTALLLGEADDFELHGKQRTPRHVYIPSG